MGASALEHLWRARFLLLLVALGALQHTIQPSVPYLENTFFAAGHGGAEDCEATPKADACREGAADAALYRGWAGAASHAGAMLLAVSLGLHSDSVGRRPLIRSFGVLNLAPLVALALHVELGVSLWPFLLAQPAVEAFDVSGVYLALVSDLVPQQEERAGAYGAFIGGMLLLLLVLTPLAFLVPRRFALAFSLLAGATKVLYLFVCFPETAGLVPGGPGPPPRPRPLGAAREALRLLTRDGFIARMALVLALSGLGASGYAIVMPPFLEGYLGFGRREKLALFLGAAASAIVTFLLVLRPLMARLGDVRVLQLSLGFSALFPALLAACTDVWQVMLLSFLLAGPLLVSVPVVSAIKSNLVAADEQGLVQGAIASIGRGSATVGFLFFGYLFRGATHRGELSSWSSVRGPFLAMAAVGLAAFLAALPLGDMPRAAREAPAALELAGLRRHRDAEEPPGSAPAPCAEVIGPPFEPGT